MSDQPGAVTARNIQDRRLCVPVFSRLAGWATAMAFAILCQAEYSVVSAADKKGPIEAKIAVEIEHDWTTHSDDPDAEVHDTSATFEVGLAARLAEELTLKSLLEFEEVKDPGPGEDRFFKDHGLYAEELFVEFETGLFAFRAGKFGQKFGIAWDAAPGIWGTDFAEDYEIAEQIGVAVDFNFGGKEMGKHVITAGTFFADTTVLSESLFTNRGRTRKSDGGAGNTEDFSSFSIALEGKEIPALPGVMYHLAYLSRHSDAPGETDETGLVAGSSIAFKLGAVEVTPLVEIASLRDAGGAPGVDATYLTTSVAFVHGPWSFALSRTGRNIDESGMPDIDDSLFQASLGYAFENGISVAVGWRRTEEEGIDSDTVGILIGKEFSI
jgi:hypothetical protein